MDGQPCCGYERVTRSPLCAFVEEVGAVKGRTKTLLSIVLGTVVFDILLRLITGWRVRMHMLPHGVVCMTSRLAHLPKVTHQ